MAIGLNPSYAGAYLLKAIWFCIHERYDEAIETIRKSIQLDPFFPPGIYAYAAILMLSGHIQESSDQLDKLFEISPQFPDALSLKGTVCQRMGEYEKAEELFMVIQKIQGFESVANASLGGLYFSMNQAVKAKECLEKLLRAEETGRGQKVAFNLAFLYAIMDKPDEMFHFLNKSVESKDNYAVYILAYQEFRKYRKDPRFADLIKKIGLWR